MTQPRHPKELQSYSRRDFLRRAAVTGAAIPSFAAILAACGKGAQSTVGGGGGGATGASGASKYGTGGVAGAPYPLARLDTDHRTNVLRYFATQASEQVVFLSQPDEVHGPYLQAIAPRWRILVLWGRESIGLLHRLLRLLEG